MEVKSMNFERLKYFIMVVEKGSISKAAIALHMTQPPLSTAIGKLEKEIDTKLFTRKGKQLKLTEPGKLLYKRGIELVFSSESIINEVKEKEYNKAGSVTIGCSTVANLTIIPKIVERIHRSGKDISIKVLEGNAAFILEQLELHKMDIGLVRNTFDKKNFHTKGLISEPIYVAVPPGHPLSNLESISFKDLSKEKFLMPYTSVGTGTSDLILENCQAAGYNPNIIYWGTETLPMINIVNRGLGIAFVPALFTLIDNITLPPLIPIHNSTLHAKLNLVTLKGSIDSSATKGFLEIATDVIDEMNFKLYSN
jgi:DNA-binding transcriptional LysR family regulator